MITAVVRGAQLRPQNFPGQGAAARSLMTDRSPHLVGDAGLGELGEQLALNGRDRLGERTDRRDGAGAVSGGRPQSADPDGRAEGLGGADDVVGAVRREFG